MSIPLTPNNAAHGADAVSVNALLSIGAGAKADIRTLVVDDEHSLRETCGSLLGGDGYDVTVCGRGQEALDVLKRWPFDIALVDLYMSQVDGLTLLRAALATNPDTIVIMMTGNPSVESSIEALRQGAWDYLPKPFSAQHLQIAIGRAVHTVVVGQETREQEAELDRQPAAGDKVTLLGTSAAFRSAIELARKVAPTDASVFVTGESGAGKELVAQFIHQHSRRSSRPFVAVNCAALPEPLLESELVEMSKPIQAKLLRVIQDGVVRRVGSETTDAVVNVRFIAATNGDPEAAVKSGTLREDLYYRLRVVPINVPRLQNRTEDIPLLANHFLNYYWHAHRGAEHGNAVPTLSDSAVRALRTHAWPGNVRELQNVIEHAVVLLEPGVELRAEDLPFSPGQSGVEEAASPTAAVTMPLEETYHVARERLLAEFERRYLTWLVGQADNNISRAARIAAVDRTTLYRLMERHGLQRRLTQTTEES